MKADSTARKEDLSDPVAQARDFDLAAIGQVDCIRADTDLAAGSRVSTQRFTGKDRLVQLGVSPGAPAGNPKIDVSRDKADPADAARRRPLGEQRSARLDCWHRLGLGHLLP